MADLKLTTLDDIDFSTEDLQLVDGIDAIAQHLRIRLRFFLGEWFLDTRIGVPYYRDILVKVANENIIRETLRQVVGKTPGVLSIEEFTFTFGDAERQARVLRLDFLVKTEAGDLRFNEPLIIE